MERKNRSGTGVSGDEKLQIRLGEWTEGESPEKDD